MRLQPLKSMVISKNERMINMKKFILSISLLLVFTLSACVEAPEDHTPIPSFDQETFNEVFGHLIDNHYSQPTIDQLWEGAIRGLITSLEDPYTQYLSAAEFRAFQDSLGESFVGIGVLIENINDNVVIRQVFDNSPAERAGLLPGDVITFIDGEDYTGRSYFDKVSAVTGPEGSDVEVGVIRSGVANPIFFTMTRARIQNPTVVVEVFEEDDKTIGYIRVNSFGSQTFFLFNSYLAMLEVDSGIDALIIDLRNNSGGFLSTVNNMLNMFLSSDGLPMFQIEEWVNGERSVTPYFASNTNTKSYPIITLINGNSASASEVFAAGMIEAGGFEVVGTPSFGKGTMQVPKSLRSTDGDELQASTGRWLTPEGNWINKRGGDFESVIPTVVVEQNPVFSAFSIFLSEGEVLRFDQVSPQIQNAQIILTALGYELRQDGYFDQNTVDQLKIYQQNNNLPVTGDIDAATAAKLSEALFNYRRNLDHDFQLQEALRMLSE